MMATAELMAPGQSALLQPYDLERAQELALPLPPPPAFAAYTHPQSVGAEQFRRLAVGLRHLRAHRNLRKLLVTSAAPGEGKSISAANLALTLARPGNERVLLLEGDLHRPALLGRMGVHHDTGLADWLEQRAPLAACLARWPQLPLWVLPAARSRSLPLELLQACAPGEILRPLEPLFDWIVVDAPPLLPMADACHWACAADGVLLVVRVHRTRRSDLEQAMRQLERETWLGVILNDCASREHAYYSQYYPPALKD
ncbi:MAG: CpsD/CapB family tyrosine-protein kinase [Terriglobales bacterium]